VNLNTAKETYLGDKMRIRYSFSTDILTSNTYYSSFWLNQKIPGALFEKNDFFPFLAWTEMAKIDFFISSTYFS